MIVGDVRENIIEELLHVIIIELVEDVFAVSAPRNESLLMENLKPLRNGWGATFKFGRELANTGFALAEALEETESLWFSCRT